MIGGSITALVTPFKDNAVDEDKFAQIIEHQFINGTRGVVPVGTTGESATMDLAERKRVVALCVEIVAGRMSVIAGTGTNDTAAVIELQKDAKAVGADASLVVAPYYNKPSQAGIIAHFEAIANAVELPIVLYNVPGRTIVDMSVDTVAHLSQHPNIIAIKDATGEVERVTQHLRRVPSDFILLSGDDGSALGFNAHGGHGMISVTSNVAPSLCAQYQEASLKGDFVRAREINARLQTLNEAMFCEPSPAPVKYALSLLGLCGPEARLPIIPLSDSAKARVEAAMKVCGLL
ncbi:4-hydroxy-tetrahydrodipicolinate synthase [Woodsholea maritima]|uniref:4-hydroxy-tetrahydrodipicolinate synthase n=1 Tax=Woodsholea maritima TaxID=240237 RepID=UPI00036AE6DA|nr:4-hydroxy-tetrahydrodipicolinate synthase [Woodsholea maritima]